MLDPKKTKSIIAGKAYQFSLDIISLYKFLCEVKREFFLSKQILRSGTSIGANIHEALSSESKSSFIYRLNVSLKEARETLYWLHLLKDSEYINTEQFDKLNISVAELLKMLTAIIKTSKEKYLPERK